MVVSKKILKKIEPKREEKLNFTLCVLLVPMNLIISILLAIFKHLNSVGMKILFKKIFRP